MKLLEKLLAITDEIGSLSKGGTNSAQKYKYIKGEDAMSTFRELEVKHKIKVIPSIQTGSMTVVPKGENGLVTSFVVDYTIYDVESDEKMVVTLPAQGYDSTDKGVYKGLTGAYKYFILQTFSASTDDAEKDDAKSYAPKTATPIAAMPSFTKTSAPIVKPVAAPVVATPAVPVTEVVTNDDSVEQSTTVSPSRFQPKGGFTKLVAPVKVTQSVNQGVVATSSTIEVPAVYPNTTNGSGTKPTFSKGKFSDFIAKNKQ